MSEGRADSQRKGARRSPILALAGCLGALAFAMAGTSQGQEAPSQAALDTASYSGPNVVPAEVPLLSLGLFFGPRDADEIALILRGLEDRWSDGFYAPLIEITTLTANGEAREQIFEFVSKRAGIETVTDAQTLYQWLWNQPETITTDYADFKGLVYRQIDARFEDYFAGRQNSARIRLDEIRWGGVVQDGIPPLRQPEMVAAEDAGYLDDSNIVFGIEINGDARAYPQRILAWHEMFVDTIGGVDIAGVYCTLCGTVIPYRTVVDGTNHRMGTSGFLYRSNKLMYDQATQSLWSTMRGEPVLGPLVGQGIKMDFEPVITTTWGEWKRRHPDTTVLSLNTGFNRNYGEGDAYRAYFATDELMFNTPFNAENLDNKQEVLGLRFPGAPQDQLAIDTAFLADNPLYVEAVGFQTVLVLTDASGANRVYDPEDVTFVSYNRDRTLMDDDGVQWTLDEDSLVAEDGRRLARLPAHRSFWFGWHAAFPQTRLIM